MDSLAAPLRIEPSGRFARSDRIDAVCRVLGSMLATRSSDWPAAPWFGLAELAEVMNTDVTEQGSIGQAMNDALDQLGIEWVRVATVTVRREGVASGEIHLDVALKVQDRDDLVHQKLL